MKDIIFSTATELARAIRKKQFSAVEVLDVHLVQIVGRRWSEERLLAIAKTMAPFTAGFQRPDAY